MLTGWAGPVLLGWCAGLTEAHTIQGQNPKRVPHVWGQVQSGCGLGAGNLCHVDPDAFVVTGVFILNEELWDEHREKAGEV